MRGKSVSVAALAVSGLALALSIVGPANAAHWITGKNIKNGTVTGLDIRNNSLGGADVLESKLGTVPTASKAGTASSASGLGILPSGHSQSGTFGGGGGDGSTSGWYGEGLTFPLRLATPIANDHIIDTDANPDPVHCPSAGHAAPGYLCLYFHLKSGTGTVYGYSADSAYPTPSVGVSLYFPILAASAYANGSWTVTAP